MSSHRKQLKGLAFIGVGFSFAATVGFLTWAGWLGDERWGTTPWLTVAGAFVGISAAFYNLIQVVSALERQDRTDKD